MSQEIDICHIKLYNKTKVNKSNAHITKVMERNEDYEHNSKIKPHF